MKIRFLTCLLTALFAAGALLAQEKTYSCSMKVENPKSESHRSEGKTGKGKSSKRTQVETVNRKIVWPTSVSFRGKSLPSGIRLNCLFLGRQDDSQIVLGRQVIPVKLNEKGDFKTNVISPEAKLVETKQRTGGRRNGGTRSETTGTRISGCVIQLLVGDKVERTFVSKSSWSKLATKYPLPEEEILKLH